MATPSGVNILREVVSVPPDYGLGIGAELVDGAAADTNIAVTGIKESAEIICCIEFAVTSNDPTDRTSTTSATSDGNIQCTAATTNDKLLVIFRNKDE